jgi:hypothetical protein
MLKYTIYIWAILPAPISDCFKCIGGGCSYVICKYAILGAVYVRDVEHPQILISGESWSQSSK